VLEIADDPDDRMDLAVLGGAPPDLLANGVLPRPVALGHRLVDDHHVGSIDIVLLREYTALHQWDPHRAEVARLDDLPQRPSFCIFGQIAIDQSKGIYAGATTEGHGRRQGHRGHTGKGRDPLQDLTLKPHHLVLLGEGLRHRHDPERQEVLGIETALLAL